MQPPPLDVIDNSPWWPSNPRTQDIWFLVLTLVAFPGGYFPWANTRGGLNEHSFSLIMGTVLTVGATYLLLVAFRRRALRSKKQ